jgi:hypothetical protein
MYHVNSIIIVNVVSDGALHARTVATNIPANVAPRYQYMEIGLLLDSKYK